MMLMREGSAAPAAIRRADYRAPAYWIREVELTFDLDAAKTIVASRMQIERNAARAAEPLVLHAEELNLLRVLVDGQSVAFRHEDNLLTIDAPAADRFLLEVRNTISPAKNTALSGLYASGSGLFTQCEAEGFRRITCYLDRPDVMATYTVLLRADKAKYPVLLSNGNLVEQGELEGGRHYAKWHDPFPKPSYLFALVAADLVAREQWVKTRRGKEHLLQVYVQQGDLEKTEHAMNALIASLVWDEQRFGLPLDLDRFMVVGVSDFNMGAMENKGLNIFNTSALLASPATATDVDFARIESIVAHEYFHNWTGNRVTCRDWFQLSLKEGLTVFRDQEFSMDMAGSESARAVCRIDNVRDLRTMQFPEDSGSMAHPVRPDSYVEINNFYTMTVYEKGAEVVRMYQTLVGREGFAAGLKLYFQRHDGHAVTCDDFAQAMADANPTSALATRLDAFKRWYSQSGTPRVKARGQHDAAAQTYTLTLTQHVGAGKQPQVIPVALGLMTRGGTPIALQLAGEAASGGTDRVLVLDAPEQTFTFTSVAEAPVPSLLRSFSAPVVLDDGLGDDEWLVLLAHDSDPFNRWEAGQKLMLARILAAVKAGAPLQLDAPLIAALRAVLTHPQLDPAFKAMALTPPAESYIAEQLDEVDPEAIHAAVMALEAQMAHALHADWAAAFDANQVAGGYRPDAEQSGPRALANLALAMLVLDARRSGDAVWPGRAYRRFKDASHMTDRMGALSALVRAHADLAEPALAQFHARHKSDPLIIDKWFSLQARAPEMGGRVFARARQLAKHPDFTLKNPNRARSLIGSLCLFNPGAFHRKDAAGYVFWAEQVLAMDAINPQVAGRLARVMDRWTQLAEPYRSAAREAITRVAAKDSLSPDVREIIDRALAAATPEPQA